MTYKQRQAQIQRRADKAARVILALILLFVAGLVAWANWPK